MEKFLPQVLILILFVEGLVDRLDQASLLSLFISLGTIFITQINF